MFGHFVRRMKLPELDEEDIVIESKGHSAVVI